MKLLAILVITLNLSLLYPLSDLFSVLIIFYLDNPIEEAVEGHSSHQAPSPSSDTQNPQTRLDTAHPDEALIQEVVSCSSITL
jgi:hypothetical protein